MKNKRAIFLFLGFTMLVNALLVNGAYIFQASFQNH